MAVVEFMGPVDRLRLVSQLKLQIRVVGCDSYFVIEGEYFRWSWSVKGDFVAS